MAHSYRQLLVWQKARSLTVAVYRATEKFPKTETYGLTSQLRRASVSIVSNIAEGQGRRREASSAISWGSREGRYLSWRHSWRLRQSSAILTVPLIDYSSSGRMRCLGY